MKPVLVATFAEDEATEPLPVAFDTQIAAYILNAALRSQTIADVVAENLDQILPPPADLPATARAGLEALSAIAVREPLQKRLVETSLERLFREVELPLIPVLARIEAVGVALDREALAVLEREFGAEIARLEQEIYVDVGHEFNLGSPKQLEQVLFFELNLPKGRKTKTGYSTDASVLEDLRPAHPMIDKLLEWRVYTKLRSTYVEALPTLIADDGRLHTTFHQAVASTGRLSSSDPNLQNIPIRTELGGGSGARSSPATPPRSSWPRTIRRSSCGSSPMCPATSTSRTPSRARPTSTGKPLHACSTRTPPTSPRTSGPWPRWSTSDWPTG